MNKSEKFVETLEDMNRDIVKEDIFLADLHVHSRYSMATSKRMDLEHMDVAAQLKGLDILATGDFTHAGWMNELQSKLIPDGSGLYRLLPEIEASISSWVPPSCRKSVRFILSTEICCIYRQDGRVRKGHYLVMLSDMTEAEQLCRKLGTIGNLASDGRPVLNISAYRLLEMVMEISEKAWVIPAHIWTPWFSVFGSKSGYDCIEECFGDLSDRIFALETGLSSDPAMNRSISRLDRFSLVSNSDAHSPEHIGREANWFRGECTFEGIRKGLDGTNPSNFIGTIEWYPQEGKYHYDGHAACHFSCHPDETRRRRGICPVCGKPLTIGVLNRCRTLADRDHVVIRDRVVCYSVPLVEVLSQLFRKNASSKSIQRTYSDMVKMLGPELDILHRLSLETIGQVHSDLAVAVRNMRCGNIVVTPGYDGRYGSVRISP